MHALNIEDQGLAGQGAGDADHHRLVPGLFPLAQHVVAVFGLAAEKPGGGIGLPRLLLVSRLIWLRTEIPGFPYS